jgi:hypothetical protein
MKGNTPLKIEEPNTAAVEPLLRAGATAESDTRLPPDAVADELEHIAKAAEEAHAMSSRKGSGIYKRTSDSASSAARGRCAASQARTSANRRAAA